MSNKTAAPKSRAVMDASTYTHKKRVRQEYMNYVSNQVALDKQCIAQSKIKSGLLDAQDLANGSKYTSCDDYVCAIVNACGPRPRNEGNGSAQFPGNISANIRIPHDVDFDFGTGDFTIEWFHYLLSKSGTPRIFSIGSYPFASLSVSVEESNEYFLWAGRTLFYLGQLDSLERWIHIALVRQNGNVTLYGNGKALLPPQVVPFNIESTEDLYLGNESPSINPSSMYYKGYLTNFHIVKGVALYTADFTPPTTPIQPTPDTKLLLTMIGNQITQDSSGLKKDLYATENVKWVAESPFAPFAGLEQPLI